MVEAVKPRKLAVGTMVRFAYRSVFGRLELIPELGWIMLLALLAVAILPDLLIPGRHVGGQFRIGWQDGAQAVVALLALAAFAVRWHQSILLGDPRRQPPSMFFRGWVRFLVYGCVLYGALGIVVAATAFGLAWSAPDPALEGLIALGALIVIWLVLLATARLALLFPAAACGRPLGVGAAWRLMRGNSWRMVWVSILTALPLKIVAFGLAAIMIAAALPAGSEFVTTPPMGFVILSGVIEAVSDMLLAALGASVLSGFYRELVAWRASGANP